MSLARRDALLSGLIGQVWPFAPLLEAVQVAPTARVLDIGGGEGSLLAELQGRGHTGQAELVDLLSDTDAHALPFVDVSFDAVFMLRVLAHLHAPDVALAEAMRVLAPGGQLIVVAHGPRHLAELFGPGQPSQRPSVGKWRPLDITLPIVLKQSEQYELAESYGKRVQPVTNMQTALHLSGWLLKRATLHEEG